MSIVHWQYYTLNFMLDVASHSRSNALSTLTSGSSKICIQSQHKAGRLFDDPYQVLLKSSLLHVSTSLYLSVPPLLHRAVTLTLPIHNLFAAFN